MYPAKAMPHEICLIRHGETEWSLSGAHTSRTDLPLTSAGCEKAAEIGRYLANRPFALVLTSPLLRARETCRLAGFGDCAQIEPNLHEWDCGSASGLIDHEIHEIHERGRRPILTPQGRSAALSCISCISWFELGGAR